MNTLNIEKQINQSVKDLPSGDYLLGRTLVQPFSAANSGSRKLMHAIHLEQHLPLIHAEVPLTQTGYESEFGRRSTSYIEAESDYEVISKIYKFSFNKNHYYLIVKDLATGIYDVIERVTYNHNTERYGYTWNNTVLDSLQPGSVIPKGSVIKTSTGYDEYGNKMNGVNLVTMYLSCAQNMEDSIIISESASKKLETNLIKNTSIMINDNDILLNLYGDDATYKTFPNIGEPIKGGIFCGVRRLENENVLFSMSQSRLKDIMISDKCILMEGYVADIDVYCNNPEALASSEYNKQLYAYYQEKINFCTQINDIVAPIAMNNKMTYRLEELYAICRDTIMGKQFFKEKQFNNVIMDVTIIQTLPMEPGDKLSDRYGGKGVVSQVLPDDQMPILDNGVRVDIIKNQSTCINRENIGQLHEQSLSFIGMRLIDYFNTEVFTYADKFEMWYKFVNMIDPNLANMCADMIGFDLKAMDYYDEMQVKSFIDSIVEMGGIMISTPPFTTPVDIFKIEEIYNEFPFIKPYKVLMPVPSSTGKIRFVPSKKDLVVGKIYNYRLKQYAEEKFSVTSLAATNLKNLNTRSKANKVYESKYTKTPIMFGAMESGDLAHLGMQYVVMNLMLYSSSPQARRLFEELLVGDPYDINIQLDADSKNRNAEIINAMLKTMGLELVFEKIPKEKKRMIKDILYKTVPLSEWKPKTNMREVMGYYDDLLDLQYAVVKQGKTPKNPMYKLVMARDVNEDGTIKYKTNLRSFFDGEV